MPAMATKLSVVRCSVYTQYEQHIQYTNYTVKQTDIVQLAVAVMRKMNKKNMNKCLDRIWFFVFPFCFFFVFCFYCFLLLLSVESEDFVLGFAVG